MSEGRYGRLKVLDRTWGPSIWKCRCRCGRICVVPVSQLRNEETVSCGCVTQRKPPLKVIGGFRSFMNERSMKFTGVHCHYRLLRPAYRKHSTASGTR